MKENATTHAHKSVCMSCMNCSNDVQQQQQQQQQHQGGRDRFHDGDKWQALVVRDEATRGTVAFKLLRRVAPPNEQELLLFGRRRRGGGGVIQERRCCAGMQPRRLRAW
jgi:hypothetical protein